MSDIPDKIRAFVVNRSEATAGGTEQSETSNAMSTSSSTTEEVQLISEVWKDIIND